MKTKNAFEASGNSPTKISKSGAPIQTGRGLEEIKRHIESAFERVRHLPSPLPSLVLEELKVKKIYTQEQKDRFHARAKSLAAAALTSSHISKAMTPSPDWIVVPVESAEELIAQAVRRLM